MDVRYYHLRNEKTITATVAIAKVNGRLSRGIAVVNPTDNPCKATGRKLALARLKVAVEHEKTVLFRADRAGTNIPAFSSKIAYGAVATAYEKKILGE